MITAIGFLTFHRLESNLKSNEQDLQSIQIAAGDSAEPVSLEEENKSSPNPCWG